MNEETNENPKRKRNENCRRNIIIMKAEEARKTQSDAENDWRTPQKNRLAGIDFSESAETPSQFARKYSKRRRNRSQHRKTGK